MAIIGIIGIAEATKSMVTKGLADLQSAVEEGEEFWAIVGVAEEPPEAVQYVIDWLIEQGVAYDLVSHTDFFEIMPDEYKDGADKTFKTKLYEDKVVDRLIEYEGTHLLVLAGNDEAPSDAVQDAAQKAYDAGIKVLDLADALAEIDFAPENVDAPEPVEETAEEVDWDAKGAEAEIGDGDAQELMTGAAAGFNLDEDEVNAMTWVELGAKLTELVAAIAKPSKAASKKAPAKAAASEPEESSVDEPTGWTKELLSKKDLKELRALATQSGIEGAAKMGAPALRTELLALSSGGTRTSTGTPLNTGIDTGEVELDEALAQIIQGLKRFANFVASK